MGKISHIKQQCHGYKGTLYALCSRQKLISILNTKCITIAIEQFISAQRQFAYMYIAACTTVSSQHIS